MHPPICTVLQANASESLLSSRFLNLVCRHVVDLLRRWIVLYAWPMPTGQLRDRKQPNGNWTHKPSVFGQHTSLNPYPTAFPYGNGMVLHFYQQQESSTTKTVHKVINKGLKTYV